MLSKAIIVVVMSMLPLGGQFASEVCTEAVIYAKAKDYAKAKELFLQSIAINPYYYRAHYGYGRVCLLTGDIASAIHHLSIAVRLDASAAGGWFYLGFAFFFNKNYVQALHCFLKAYDRDAAFIESLYNAAVIFEKIGNEHKAQLYYHRYFHEKYKEDTGILF